MKPTKNTRMGSLLLEGLFQRKDSLCSPAAEQSKSFVCLFVCAKWQGHPSSRMSATSRASTMGIIALLLRDKNICPLQDVSGWGITIPAWPKFSLLLSEISSPIGAFLFLFLFFFSSFLLIIQFRCSMTTRHMKGHTNGNPNGFSRQFFFLQFDSFNKNQLLWLLKSLSVFLFKKNPSW